MQAIPQSPAFLLRVNLRTTLVLLTLWYEFDTAVRDRGETPPVRLTVQQLNDALTAKFEPSGATFRGPPSCGNPGARPAQEPPPIFPDPAFEQTRIEILPTLKRVIPFQDIAEWNRHADRYLAGGESGEPVEGDEVPAETVPPEEPTR